MDRVVNVEINGQYVRKDSKNAGVMGESNVTTLHITMDETWRGFGKRVVWRDANGENAVSVVLFEANTSPNDPLEYDTLIPTEPLAVQGKCSFTIEGYQQIGNIKAVSLSVIDYLYVAASGSDYSSPAEPTPEEYEQILEKLGEVEEEVKKSATEAESWAVGGTGTREGEDTDNSKYYASEAKKSENHASNHAQAASESERNARESAEAAASSATSAAASAGASASSAGAAASSAAAASQSSSSASKSALDAAESAANASKSEQSAEDFAENAKSSADKAAESVKRSPYIDPNKKTWFVWDSNAGSFVDTGIVAEGQSGIEANGLWSTHISDDGYLVVTYTGDDPPPLSINENGELVYSLVDGQEVNLGKVTGSGGGGGADYNIGSGLKLEPSTNTLSVDTAAAVESGNDKPITSAAVFEAVGNVEVLLKTI